MYKFIHETTVDYLDNKVPSTTKVETTINTDELTWMDVLSHFKVFLETCGYNYLTGETITFGDFGITKEDDFHKSLQGN